MKKKFTTSLFNVLLIFSLSITNCFAQDETILVKDSVINDTMEDVFTEDVDTASITKEITQSLTKEDKKKIRDQKRIQNRKDEITFDEFICNWETPKATGNEYIDNFCTSANKMLFNYKDINDSINFIKIETFEIPDDGDGITTAVKITDGNGNKRTKEAIASKWTMISLDIVGFTLQSTNLILSSANFVTSVINDPLQAIALIGSIKQLKQSTQALKLLTREMGKTNALINSQKAMLATAKQN